MITEEVPKNLEKASERQASNYNLGRKPVEFKIGDKVLERVTKLSKKANNKAGELYDHYEGPFIAKKKIFPTIHELKNLKGKSIGESSINDITLENVNTGELNIKLEILNLNNSKMVKDQ